MFMDSISKKKCMLLLFILTVNSLYSQQKTITFSKLDSLMNNIESIVLGQSISKRDIKPYDITVFFTLANCKFYEYSRRTHD